MLDLELVTPPAVAALSAADARAYLRLDSTDQDTLLADLVASAVGHLEGKAGILGRALIEQTWRLCLERFPICGGIRLPLPPLISVTSITYVDAAGATQTLSASEYVVHAGGLALVEPVYGHAWPSARCQRRSIAVTYKAGYGAADTDVPRAIRQAVKFMVADLFEHRETGVVGATSAEVKTSLTVDRLLRPFRIPRL